MTKQYAVLDGATREDRTEYNPLILHKPRKGGRAARCNQQLMPGCHCGADLVWNIARTIKYNPDIHTTLTRECKRCFPYVYTTPTPTTTTVKVPLVTKNKATTFSIPVEIDVDQLLSHLRFGVQDYCKERFGTLITDDDVIFNTILTRVKEGLS